MFEFERFIISIKNMGIEDMLCGDDAEAWFQGLVIFFVIIGIWKTLLFILRHMVNCFRFCCKCKQNLHQKYG